MVLVGRLGVLLGCAAVVVACQETTDGEEGAAGGEDGTSADGAGTGGTGGTSSSSTSSGGTTLTETGDSTATGGAFIQAPDAPPEIECDLFAQDCPVGEKCTIWAHDGGDAQNATKCVPIGPDPKAVGEPCTVVDSPTSGLDDCDLGGVCWHVDPDTNAGYCVALCTGSEEQPECESPCEACTISGSGFPFLCLPFCDPLTQNCPPGNVCAGVWGYDGFPCVPDQSGDAGQYKDPCESYYECDPGLFCADAVTVPGCQGTTGCCTPFCGAAAANPACPDTDLGVECVPWPEDPTRPECHSGEVGVCALP